MASNFTQHFFKSTSSVFTHVDEITFHGIQQDILHVTNDQKLFCSMPEVSIKVYHSSHSFH